MTREIEYRAYWKSKGEIRDVVDIYFGKKQEVQSVRVLCEHDGMSYPSNDIYVDDFILMQYTGIKDENEVKCFYDDVVKINLGGEYYQFVVADVDGNTVILDMHNNGAVYDFLVVYEKEFEVIGNIHEDKK